MKCDFNCNLVHYELKVVKHDGNGRQVPAFLHIWKVLVRIDLNTTSLRWDFCWNGTMLWPKTTLRSKGVFQLTTHRFITEQPLSGYSSRSRQHSGGWNWGRIHRVLLIDFLLLSVSLHLSGLAAPTVYWSFPHQSLIKKTSLRLTYLSVLWRHLFVERGFPGCQELAI